MPHPRERDLAENVDEIRGALGLTYRELARLARVDRGHLWRVLAGRTKTGTPELLGSCLIVLGTVLRSRDRAHRRVVAELLDEDDQNGQGNGDAA